MGIGGLSVVLLISATTVDNITAPGTGIATTWGALVAQDIVWGGFFFSLIGWTVSNTDVAVQADFFHRDAISWKRGGRIAAIILILSGYVLASLPSWLLPQTNLSVFQLLFGTIVIGPALYTTLVLGFTYFRIKDNRIKTYTKWVGLSILSLVLLFLPYDFALVIAGFVMVFCMYRAVGALSIRTHSLTAG
jgi:hypothetical protein